MLRKRPAASSSASTGAKKPAATGPVLKRPVARGAPVAANSPRPAARAAAEACFDEKVDAGSLEPAPIAEFYSKEFLVRHISDILGFYTPRAVDPDGGYRQSFYIDGTQFNPGFQQIVSSARMVINFMLCGKLLKNNDLLEMGLHGLRYLEEGHWDPCTQTYAFTMEDHSRKDMTQQSYGYAFVLAAHAAARAAGAVPAAEGDAAVAKVFDLMETRFWLPEKGAYADTLSADGVLSDYRGQNSNMHICEAMIAAYEATHDGKYLDRAEVLACTFTRTLAGKCSGFVWEHYSQDFEIDWEYNKDDPKNLYRPWGFQPGHQNEWAKNLLNIHRYRPQEWMVQRASELFNGSWENCWDKQHGGLVYGFGPDGKWCDDDKYFWVQAESMASAALLYQATEDPRFLKCYNLLWKYSWQNFVDHDKGAWYGLKLTRDGQRYNEEKAFAGGKCDYHTMVSCIEALRVFADDGAQ